MRHGRIIYVLGDVHGEFHRLNDFINKNIRQDKTLRSISPYWKADKSDLEVIIFQCGDFAYFWPLYNNKGIIKNRVDFLQDGYVSLYWIGGNHEDWDELDILGPNITELERGIFFCPFASTLRLTPDITVLFAGGAESSDKDYRLREMERGAPKIWWGQEGIGKEELKRLERIQNADWIISHTAPYSFDLSKKMLRGFSANEHLHEPSRLALEQVLLKYEPKRWFFGHFHHYMSGLTDGCDWTCLSYIGSGERSWEKLYLEWND